MIKTQLIPKKNTIESLNHLKLIELHQDRQINGFRIL